MYTIPGLRHLGNHNLAIYGSEFTQGSLDEPAYPHTSMIALMLVGYCTTGKVDLDRSIEKTHSTIDIYDDVSEFRLMVDINTSSLRRKRKRSLVLLYSIWTWTPSQSRKSSVVSAPFTQDDQVTKTFLESRFWYWLPRSGQANTGGRDS
jgi:hypothetical protein